MMIDLLEIILPRIIKSQCLSYQRHRATNEKSFTKYHNVTAAGSACHSLLISVLAQEVPLSSALSSSG